MLQLLLLQSQNNSGKMGVLGWPQNPIWHLLEFKFHLEME